MPEITSGNLPAASLFATMLPNAQGKYLAMTSQRPNFLFIGPDKSGSTWLYETLKVHSGVHLSCPKELFFFDRFYDRGWSWYASFFQNAEDQHRVVGEICHDYLFSPIACQRIAGDLPLVKLMVCLREPSQRAFSAYLYLIKTGLLACNFETALNETDDLIEHGRYAKHLSHYLKHFNRDQIHVAVFDDLVADPQGFFDSICDFLELERIALSDELKQKVLPAARPRSRYVAKAAKMGAWRARRMGLPGVVGKIKESALVRRILYSPYRPGEKPSMSPQTRRYLHRIFLPEVEQLDELLGTQLSVRWGYSRSG